MKKIAIVLSIGLTGLGYSQVTTSGNSYTSSSFVGSSSSSTDKNLYFKTNNTERMRLTSTGQFAFGTTTPMSNAGFQIHNSLLMLSGGSPYGGAQIVFGDNTPTGAGKWSIEYNSVIPGREGLNFWRVYGGNFYLFLHDNGKVGINTNNPTAQLTVNGNMLVGNPETVSMPSGYKLYVETGILTERLKVAIKGTGNWSDYVFASNYNLMNLKQVETFINENNHLPNIPSAEDMVENGLDVAEMDALLLSKIEELTLYVIQLQKEIDALKVIEKTKTN